MKIIKEIKDVNKSAVVDRSQDLQIEKLVNSEIRRNQYTIRFDDIVSNEVINIGHIFATQLGGVPETNFPAYNDFLQTDPYIYSKTAAFEVAKYTQGEAALHLVDYGTKQFYQIARIITSEVFASSLLTDVHLTTMTTLGSFQLAKGAVQGYKVTHYWLDEKGKVWMESLLADYNYTILDLSREDKKAAKLQMKTLTPWDHIPVIIERPLFSTSDIVKLAYPQLRDIHEVSKSFFAKIKASKTSWLINEDALIDSDKGAIQLKNALNGNNDNTDTAIIVKSYDGQIGNIFVPVGVPQDGNYLIDVRNKVRYEMYDLLKIPDMSKQSSSKANKQDKEVVASTINRNALLDSLRLQKERLWVERAKDWAMRNRITPPADLEAHLETIEAEDIVGVNNVNANTDTKIATDPGDDE